VNLLIQISITILCVFLIWQIYKHIQANPALLSRANLSKSFTTMGVLALILIGSIAVMVLLLRH